MNSNTGKILFNTSTDVKLSRNLNPPLYITYNIFIIPLKKETIYSQGTINKAIWSLLKTNFSEVLHLYIKIQMNTPCDIISHITWEGTEDLEQ